MDLTLQESIEGLLKIFLLLKEWGELYTKGNTCHGRLGGCAAALCPWEMPGSSVEIKSPLTAALALGLHESWMRLELG